jgi:hypothetical protein
MMNLLHTLHIPAYAIVLLFVVAILTIYASLHAKSDALRWAGYAVAVCMVLAYVIIG